MLVAADAGGRSQGSVSSHLHLLDNIHDAKLPCPLHTHRHHTHSWAVWTAACEDVNGGNFCWRQSEGEAERERAGSPPPQGSAPSSRDRTVLDELPGPLSAQHTALNPSKPGKEPSPPPQGRTANLPTRRNTGTRGRPHRLWEPRHLRMVRLSRPPWVSAVWAKSRQSIEKSHICAQKYGSTSTHCLLISPCNVSTLKMSNRHSHLNEMSKTHTFKETGPDIAQPAPQKQTKPHQADCAEVPVDAPHSDPARLQPLPWVRGRREL